ncbi:hypothetical protein AB1Y20_009041 [Prymnesium parvum]|uniref:alpha-1,2-Mannosidase n=1 Tax=Prymnesium parvum TaxID=97485 RepID=A0AB34K0G5_PRYPA
MGPSHRASAESPRVAARCGATKLVPSTRLRGSTDSSKRAASGLRQLLPVLLLAAIALYGIFFLRAATDTPTLRAGVAVAHAEAETQPSRALEPPSDVPLASVPALTPRESTANPHADPPQANRRCEGRTTPEQKYVGSFSGTDGVELQRAAGASAPIESGEMTISAWVRIDPHEGVEAQSIQTVAATKASGCTTDAQHHGVALFVNAWGTNSGQLFLSWGNHQSGCEELSSNERVVRETEWAFVSGSISEKEAFLTVNAKVVAHTRRKIGNLKAAAGGEIDRVVGGPLRIGQHADGTHGLKGYVAELGVWPSMLSEEQLAQLMCGWRTVAGVQPLVVVPFAAGKPTSSTAMTFDPADVVSTSVKALLPADSQSGGPLLVPSAEANSKTHTELLRSFDHVSQSQRATQADSLGQAIIQRGWPLPWLPPRDVYFKKGSAESNATELDAEHKREQVRGVMRRAWNAYREHAWGADEIKPVSNKSHNWLNLGATLVDCLDNLWIMGLKDEFAEASGARWCGRL